jgi:ribosomal protein S18 acetylase RimI-like enzyme
MKYHIRDARIEDAPALADTVIIPIVTAFRGIVPAQCLAWLTREESIANWREWFEDDNQGGRFLLVAELESGLVIGCALGGPQTDDPRFAGELYLLGVLPEYQGRGVGRDLVQAVAARLLYQGIPSMRVLVISVNPHRRFYEALGGQYVGEVPYDWNGVELQEALYGWPDISILLLK